MLEKFKQGVNALVRIIQRILATVLLVATYVIGVGATALYVRLFKRGIIAAKKDSATYWMTAEGFETDLEDSTRQS